MICFQYRNITLRISEPLFKDSLLVFHEGEGYVSLLLIFLCRLFFTLALALVTCGVRD